MDNCPFKRELCEIPCEFGGKFGSVVVRGLGFRA